MASGAKVALKFGFADDTDRALDMMFDTTATIASAENLKNAVKNFDPEAIKGIFISDAEATCTGVTSAVITKVTETDINLHVSTGE